MSDLSYRDKHAVVVGYGITGKAVAEFLRANGAKVRVYDDGAERLGDSAGGFEVLAVGEGFADAVRAADLVVVSPGVPRSHPVFSYARPISELELAYRHLDVPIIAVTGTNGKTTVTTLIAGMLAKSGARARAVGNIGTSMISMVDQDLDYLVVEASSFQLATTSDFHPRVAVWTNFSPDHIDWHQGLDHYRDSKMKIFANLGSGDFAVVNGDDPVVADAELRAGVERVSFGLGNFDLGVSGDGSSLLAFGEPLVYISELSRSLPHDLENALASAGAALSVGVSRDDVTAVLREFHGLPHRVEFIASLDGVSYYDDSKATTPASVIAAVEGFRSVVLIAGGKNKGLDLSPLLAISPRLKGLVTIGAAAEELTRLFGGVENLQVSQASNMAAAVEKARDAASPGDVVLLSPGCTSFDWYSSYEERGDEFSRVVRSLARSVEAL